MSRAGFGIRTSRTKIYELEKFNITKDEAESFAVPYDGFDIWNQNKDLTIQEPQIEKRIKYFHIIFIPVFPIETQWTIRNSKGLFKINQQCEDKVKSVYKKSYGPWYSFLAPILLLASLLAYSMVEIIGKKVRLNKNENKIEAKRQSLVKELDSLATPYYLILKQRFEPDNFQRVDSIINNSFYVSSLVYGTEKLESNYEYHTLFSSDSLESKIVLRDSILNLIPKNLEETSYRNKKKRLDEIIAISELEKPDLDFDFHLGGITIENLGKPITLIGFENNSTQKNKWTVKINEAIDTNNKIRAIYNPTDEPSDESNLVFVFSDGKKSYKYKVQGTFKISQSATYFTDIKIELLK